ncbi:thioesterase family protein [Desertibaculum subflavum]|uniref:thioesterase family protein n=1 Tax=Desertibaculum subflavum TaxID=2268458 RepID=UPI000E673337
MPNKPLDPALELPPAQVLPEWIDYNGHMNVAYYVLAFDKTLDRFCDRIDVGADYVKRTNQSIFTLEMHVHYRQEVLQGDPLRFTFQLLDADDKRMHYFMRMYHGTEGYLAATCEQIALHVDLGSRRTAPWPAAQRERLMALKAEHAALPRPAEAGSVIAIRRKSA